MTKIMEQNYQELNLIEMAKHRLMLEEFLVKKANLDIRDNNYRNALYWSIKFRHRHNTDLLLKYQISLMVSHNLHALFHTIKYNDIDTFIILLKLEATDINMRNDQEETLLMKAIKAESVPMVRYLINHGANLYLSDYQNRTALDYAKACKNSYVFDLVHYRILYEASQKNPKD